METGSRQGRCELLSALASIAVIFPDGSSLVGPTVSPMFFKNGLFLNRASRFHRSKSPEISEVSDIFRLRWCSVEGNLLWQYSRHGFELRTNLPQASRN
jgi:hypothetical protein